MTFYNIHRKEEFVKHHFCMLQINHMQNAKYNELLITSIKCKHTQWASVFGNTYAGKKHCHHFTWKITDIVRVLDPCFGDDANQEFDNKVRDGSFDARDVKMQGERTAKRRRGLGVALKQSMRKNLFLFRQTWPHCTICYNVKKQGEWIMPKIRRTRMNLHW